MFTLQSIYVQNQLQLSAYFDGHKTKFHISVCLGNSKLKTSCEFIFLSFLLGKYLKHQILSPRVPQPSLQPFLPPLPPFPIISNQRQEITTLLQSRPPRTPPRDQARKPTHRVPPPAGPTVSLRSPGAAANQRRLTPSPLGQPVSQGVWHGQRTP